MKFEIHLLANVTPAKSLKTLGLIDWLSRNDILVTFASEIKRSADVARNPFHVGGEACKQGIHPGFKIQGRCH